MLALKLHDLTSLLNGYQNTFICRAEHKMQQMTIKIERTNVLTWSNTILLDVTII